MKRFLRATCILMMLFVFATQHICAAEVTTAAPATESPSTWAIWDVQMAFTYGLGDANSYKLYSGQIKGNQLLAVEASFEEKFAVIDQTKVKSDLSLTRRQVINELYEVIQLALKLEPKAILMSDDALNYFVNHGLIKGRKDGDYALDQACTQEEMLVFSKRAYDYLTYSLDLDAKGAFWKISDKDNTVYLLGSIHVTDGSVYPMSQDILTAFTDSDALVVEANVLAINQADAAYVQQKMMIEGAGTIDQLISKEAYEAYVAVVKPLGIAPEVYNKLKPWYAAMLIQSVQMSNASYNASMGIDVYFLSMANNMKPIIELESVKFQIDMFDSFTPELQEAYLTGVLEGEEASNDVVGKLLADWKVGDVKDLENLIFSEEGVTDIEKEFNSKVWETRNKNMVDKVKVMLSEDSEHDYFVVVGAGHMLNDNGLVQGLTQSGYTVEQVK